MNTKRCSECEHYDPVLRGMKPTKYGWCVKRSLYPYADSQGQITPSHATRVARPEDPAKPHLVEGNAVVAHCTLFQIRRAKPTKAELMSKVTRKG